jgi:hypothetical protein
VGSWSSGSRHWRKAIDQLGDHPRHRPLDPWYILVSMRSLAERFWEKVRKGKRCWVWTAYRNNCGYGLIGGGRRGAGMLRASRVSWVLAHGDIPKGLWVLHRCCNPPCVRPSHLYLGTHKDNCRDMVRDGHSLKGERNPFAKLSPRTVVLIRRATGENAEIGRRYGVTGPTVSEIKTGKIWRHVGGPRRAPKRGPEKLCWADVRAIRAARDVTQAALARQYGVRPNTISRIKGGVRWRTG